MRKVHEGVQGRSGHRMAHWQAPCHQAPHTPRSHTRAAVTADTAVLCLSPCKPTAASQQAPPHMLADGHGRSCGSRGSAHHTCEGYTCYIKARQGQKAASISIQHRSATACRLRHHGLPPAAACVRPMIDELCMKNLPISISAAAAAPVAEFIGQRRDILGTVHVADWTRGTHQRTAKPLHIQIVLRTRDLNE